MAHSPPKHSGSRYPRSSPVHSISHCGCPTLPWYDMVPCPRRPQHNCCCAHRRCLCFGLHPNWSTEFLRYSYQVKIIYITLLLPTADFAVRVGLALLILVLVQVVVGATAHRTKAIPSLTSRFPTLTGKSPLRFVHIALGLVILCLGLYQVHEGFEEYPANSDGGQAIPGGVYVVYYIIVAIIAVTYVGGWVREALGMNRLERSQRNSLIEKDISQN